MPIFAACIRCWQKGWEYAKVVAFLSYDKLL